MNYTVCVMGIRYFRKEIFMHQTQWLRALHFAIAFYHGD